MGQPIYFGFTTVWVLGIMFGYLGFDLTMFFCVSLKDNIISWSHKIVKILVGMELVSLVFVPIHCFVILDIGIINCL